MANTDHRPEFHGELDALRREGAETVLLGCTEIPLLLEPGDEAPDLIDPARLLAEAAVRRAIA